MSERTTFDVAVVGGGATGCAAALVAAEAGLATVLFAPPAAHPAGRTAALMQPSVDFLAALEVWEHLAPQAAALKAIRLIDDTGRLIRAPEATFAAAELGLAAFGYNVANGVLVDALRARAAETAAITVVDAPAEAIEIGDASVRIAANGETRAASLAVAADGARSALREAAGIRTASREYRQAALVTLLDLDHDHDGVSTEFHTAQGPFTVVPAGTRRASLVWVTAPDRAARLAALSPEELGAAATAQSRRFLGRMQVASAVAVFPLASAIAERFGAGRVVLVGEAAHVMPPIGAQGLNLGFRDVAALGRLLAKDGATDLPWLADRYHRERAGDIRSRSLAVDALNRSLLTGFLPMQFGRAAGIGLAATLPGLRRALMRRGMGGGMGGVSG